ncbi:hypothetical protein MSAN_00511300 [Mycena sanguinolenta]|uniref:Uncharacterized protein n=1 Tax=Mycena sanguinolenta TaxID=230812 RepID=A0A8H6Z5P2_9AGAR|nr:hypothetical protein MSAN_00511300 [Mycena sanguinolenta]
MPRSQDDSEMLACAFSCSNTHAVPPPDRFRERAECMAVDVTRDTLARDRCAAISSFHIKTALRTRTVGVNVDDDLSPPRPPPHTISARSSLDGRFSQSPRLALEEAPEQQGEIHAMRLPPAASPVAADIVLYRSAALHAWSSRRRISRSTLTSCDVHPHLGPYTDFVTMNGILQPSPVSTDLRPRPRFDSPADDLNATLSSHLLHGRSLFLVAWTRP